MKLNPLEIRQLSFNKCFRGYSPVEIDSIIEGLADDLEALLRENTSYKEQIERQEKTIAELGKTEGALTDTLLMAQRVMEESKNNAEDEAKLVIRQAAVRAEEITADAVRHEAELQSEIMNLQRKKAFLVEKVRSMIQSLERDLAWEDREPRNLAPPVALGTVIKNHKLS